MNKSNMTNQYQGWVRFLACVALATLVAGLALLRVDNEDVWVAGMIGILLTPCLLLVAGIFWFQGRKADKHLAAFRNGSYLAHWTYTPEESQRFFDSERERARKEGRWYVLGFALGGGLAVGPLLLEQLGLIALPLFAMIGAIVGRGILAAVRRSEDTREARRKDVYEAFIGPESACCGGRFFTWTGFGTRLDAVEFVPGDPNALQVTSSVQSKGGRTPYNFRIPVPAGREEEARRVMAGLGY
ncbi:hypothetical protein BH23GEM3_BH23GEM3_08730 [soil metagenome]